MIPKKCDMCTQERAGKPVSLYWAWVEVDGRRHAYKQLVCADCLRERVVQLIARSEEPVLICPSCGISTADDYEAVYLTYCIPGMPMGQSEMPMCGADAAAVRDMVLANCKPLPDRGAVVGGPQPDAPTAAETWAALGIVPRGRS